MDRSNGVGSSRWDFHKRQMPPGDAPSNHRGIRPAPQPHSPAFSAHCRCCRGSIRQRPGAARPIARKIDLWHPV